MSIVMIQDVPHTITDNFQKKQFSNNKVSHVHNQVPLTNTPVRSVITTISPTTAVAPNILVGGQSIMFRLEDQIDRFHSAFLEFNYTVGNVGLVTLGSPSTWIAQLSIYTDAGATLVYQQLSNVEEFLIHGIMYNRSKHENTAAQRGTNNSYAYSLSLAPNTSGTFQIEIAKLFFNTLRLRTYSISSNILIKIQFVNNAITLNANNFTTTCNLKLHGLMEHTSIKNQILSTAKLDKTTMYYGFQRHIELLPNLQPSTKTQIRLSGITGHVIAYFLILRTTTNTTDPINQFAFSGDIATIEYTDQSNQSLVGYSPLNKTDLRQLYNYDNLFPQFSNVYYYAFSNSDFYDLSTGSSSGYNYANGFQNVVITTASTLVAGPYELGVYALTSESAHYKNTSLKTTRA